MGGISGGRETRTPGRELLLLIGCSGFGSTTPPFLQTPSSQNPLEPACLWNPPFRHLHSCESLQRSSAPLHTPRIYYHLPIGLQVHLLFVGSDSWLHKVPGQEASPRNLLGRMNAQNPADLPAGHGGTCPNSRTWWQEDQVFKRRLGPSLAT